MSDKRPLIVGLTGSIGMGKTETARMFARLGIPVHDSDAAVHRLYDSDVRAIAAVANIFPECVREGRVERSCLAARVRDDESALRRLEEIIHPFVVADQQTFIDVAARDGADIVVLDIPLLFETGSDGRMDAVVVVSASLETQRARVLARPGMGADMLDRILSRQLPDVDKRARAHFVVETGTGLDHAFEQVRSIVMALRKKGAKSTDA